MKRFESCSDVKMMIGFFWYIDRFVQFIWILKICKLEYFWIIVLQKNGDPLNYRRSIFINIFINLFSVYLYIVKLKQCVGAVMTLIFKTSTMNHEWTVNLSIKLSQLSRTYLINQLFFIRYEFFLTICRSVKFTCILKILKFKYFWHIVLKMRSSKYEVKEIFFEYIIICL